MGGGAAVRSAAEAGGIGHWNKGQGGDDPQAGAERESEANHFFDTARRPGRVAPTIEI
jgi:hypothetical protein